MAWLILSDNKMATTTKKTLRKPAKPINTGVLSRENPGEKQDTNQNGFVFTENDYRDFEELVTAIIQVRELRQFVENADVSGTELKNALAELHNKETELFKNNRLSIEKIYQKMKSCTQEKGPVKTRVKETKTGTRKKETHIEKCMKIWKKLPRDNCAECGFKNCYMFAMKVASGTYELSDCPYMD
jgi:phosphopentomutase